MTPLLIALNAILAVSAVVGIVGLLAAGIVGGRLRSDSAVESLRASSADRLAA
jgi:hypothetical protein